MKKRLNLLFLFLTVFLANCVHSMSGSPEYSNIKDDETVVFFHTSAWLDEEKSVWNIPVHGWIYEPQDSTVRKAIIEKVMEEKYGLEVTNSNEDNFDRRVNLLIADNERGKRIIIRLGGREYSLPESKENGQFKKVLKLPVDTVEKIKQGNQIKFDAVVDPDDGRAFGGAVLLIPLNGLSVISDIDDTIKISEVTDHKHLFENTFYNDFNAVPQMASVYDGWAMHQVAFHFVSSSPWQLYPSLLEFTEKSGFPWATFSLKDLRFRDETFFNLFKKGTETKPKQIEPILQHYAKRKFILIGDSGEQDPEVYASMAKKYPNQIVKIYIRNVNGTSVEDERIKQAFEGLDSSLWQLFSDPVKLALPTA